MKTFQRKPSALPLPIHISRGLWDLNHVLKGTDLNKNQWKKHHEHLTGQTWTNMQLASSARQG